MRIRFGFLFGRIRICWILFRERRDARAGTGSGAQRKAAKHQARGGGSESQAYTPFDASYSARRADITSMRAARAAGSTDAMTAAASKTIAETITGTKSGMRMPTT